MVAPWREWDITGREDAIEYAKKHNVPIPVSKKSIYSRDRNLWHLSHEVYYLLYCWCLLGFMVLFGFKDTNLTVLLTWCVSSEVSNQWSAPSYWCHLLIFNWKWWCLSDDVSYSQHFQGDILEDPANEPKEDMYMMSVSPENAPSKPEYVINPFSFHRPHLLSWISILYALYFIFTAV